MVYLWKGHLNEPNRIPIMLYIYNNIYTNQARMLPFLVAQNDTKYKCLTTITSRAKYECVCVCIIWWNKTRPLADDDRKENRLEMAVDWRGSFSYSLSCDPISVLHLLPQWVGLCCSVGRLDILFMYKLLAIALWNYSVQTANEKGYNDSNHYSAKLSSSSEQ